LATVPAMSIVRAGLAQLGVIQGAIALWALFGPRSFYADFPVSGAHWVSAHPPYNEHLIRDYGASFLAISVLALIAAWIDDRRLTIAALVVWLVAAVPHAVFHFAHSDMPSGTSGTLSLITLAINVLAPIVLLVLVRKENR
jgi:hypothetical protein